MFWIQFVIYYRYLCSNLRYNFGIKPGNMNEISKNVYHNQKQVLSEEMLYDVYITINKTHLSVCKLYCKWCFIHTAIEFYFKVYCMLPEIDVN